ncbi:Uncharacterised protein [Serratia quinivorans]|nr:Uncharacterised protein [Serratia quinivorans]CAI1769635.1 Uncharacterised protein [Serratia quinivorans]
MSSRRSLFEGLWTNVTEVGETGPIVEDFNVIKISVWASLRVL